MRRPLRKAALGSILFAGALLAVAVTAEAQQPKKVARIDFLTATSPSVELARIKAFRQGLRDIGYVEGKNIVIEWRNAEGKLDAFPRSRRS
jgi:putative tryptophan/tyrosine transport system substrate-binding protein